MHINVRVARSLPVAFRVHVILALQCRRLCTLYGVPFLGVATRARRACIQKPQYDVITPYISMYSVRWLPECVVLKGQCLHVQRRLVVSTCNALPVYFYVVPT